MSQNTIMMDQGIIWATNERGRATNVNRDCGVSLVNSGAGKQINISFYNGMADRIVGNLTHMIYGLVKDNTRIYFQASDPKKGFKVTTDSNTRCTVKRNVSPETYDMWEAWRGYYYLRYDKRVGFYYIDINEKI